MGTVMKVRRDTADELSFGYFFPTGQTDHIWSDEAARTTPKLDRDVFCDMAQAAEATGFDSLFIADTWSGHQRAAERAGHQSPKFHAAMLAMGLFAVTACDEANPAGPTVSLNERFILAREEVATVRDADVRVQFVSVTGDSRCPADAICIQGGDAIVHIRSRDIPSLEAALEKVRLAPNVDHTRSAIVLSRLITRGS